MHPHKLLDFIDFVGFIYVVLTGCSSRLASLMNILNSQYHLWATASFAPVFFVLLRTPVWPFLLATVQKADRWDWGTVLAALIGIGGYIIDGHNKRQSERRQLQIDRAQKQMNQLLVPTNIAFHSLLFCLYGFIDAHLDEINVDENTFSSDATPPPPMSDWSSADQVMRGYSSWWIRSKDGVWGSSTGKLPVAIPRELPESLMQAIRAKANGPLAVQYRLWVQNEWLPGVQRIANIILQSGHLLEAIPVSQLIETFNEPPIGMGNWKWTPRGMFFSMWLAYARAWETVVQQWQSGDFRVVRPTVGFPCGLAMYIVMSQTIVGDIEKELTGTSQMHGSRGENRNED